MNRHVGKRWAHSNHSLLPMCHPCCLTKTKRAGILVSSHTIPRKKCFQHWLQQSQFPSSFSRCSITSVTATRRRKNVAMKIESLTTRKCPVFLSAFRGFPSIGITRYRTTVAQSVSNSSNHEADTGEQQNANFSGIVRRACKSSPQKSPHLVSATIGTLVAKKNSHHVLRFPIKSTRI